MQIEEINTHVLIPYSNNPRNNESAVDAVAASIKEFGFKVPIIIDKDNVIVAGHTRLKAALKLGLVRVPCIKADDLTPEQLKAFRLADNKVGELATWDFDKLEEELTELDSLDLDFTMSDFGFDVSENRGGGSENVIEDNYDEEPPEEPKAKPGDIYALGNHRLICGDSTDVNVIDKLMGGEKIDLVLTDPPYGISIQHKDGRIGSEKKADSKGKRITGATIYAPFQNDDTTDTAEAAYNLLSTISERIIFWGGNYFTKFLPFSDGWIVWDKRCNDDMRNNFADGEVAWCSFHTPIRIYHQMWNGMIREGENEKRVHPTQKPVKMLGNILKEFSNVNNIIVDVFGGSGSTLIACEQLGRKCYMCELDPHYVDVIIDRWEKFTGKQAQLINE